jgi:predicted nuclease of predicted toxin-antitoxin system
MTLWIDAQLSPSIAAWVNENYKDIQASSVRALGLRDATDIEYSWQPAKPMLSS